MRILRKIVFGTLSVEKLTEEKNFSLGFVKGKDILIIENVWFVILNPKQLTALDNVLNKPFDY